MHFFSTFAAQFTFLYSMRTFLTWLGKQIGRVIDFFYPPFKHWFSRQFFRYGVCGVANMGFDLLLFFLAYNVVFAKKMVHVFGLVTLTPHVASLLVTFPISLMSGFLLQKYVTFSASELRGRTQLLRYMSVVALNLAINYLGLKVFVEICEFYPTPSKMLIILITTIVSYLCQKNFTFKVNG